MSKYKSDLIDIAVIIIRETEKAYCVNDGSTTAKNELAEIWIPKQFVELNDDGTMTMPEWLALDKGLI